MLKKETIEALKEPLGYYGPGAAQKWRRFVTLVEVAFWKAMTDDPAELAILQQRLDRLAHYGSTDGFVVAEKLVADIMPQLETSRSGRVQYLNTVLLPWLEKLRKETYDTVRASRRETSAAKHYVRVKDYQQRRRAALAEGLVPGTFEWRERFRKGTSMPERPVDTVGQRRWKERRQKFYGSPSSTDTELVALWETIWKAAKAAGFALP